MKVLKPGLVHEYVDYDYSAHCEAHIACLEKLDPMAGARVRAKANALVAKFGSIRSGASDLVRECSGELDRLAPKGFYFGLPNVHCNMAGFWPAGWIAGATPRNPKGGSTAQARALGAARIG